MSTKTTLPEQEKHKVVSREEWIEARKKLLVAEKELTRRSDELAKWRQELPWVKIEKDYRFENETGKVKFADLFRGRSQLIIYHFMLGPDFTAGCPSCSSISDTFDGIRVHLENHDVAFGAVSRAPLAKLLAYKQRMGWKFPWASSAGSDFNYDFQAAHTKAQQEAGAIYNFRAMPPQPPAKAGEENPMLAQIAGSTGTDWATYSRETPGMSSFILQDGEIYHTYSAYARGLDVLWGMYQWLDRAPLGRNEGNFWIRRHDEYGQAATEASDCCCHPTEAKA